MADIQENIVANFTAKFGELDAALTKILGNLKGLDTGLAGTNTAAATAAKTLEAFQTKVAAVATGSKQAETSLQGTGKQLDLFSTQTQKITGQMALFGDEVGRGTKAAETAFTAFGGRGAASLDALAERIGMLSQSSSDMGAAVKAELTTVEKAFQTLGVNSSTMIQAQRDIYIKAYEDIRTSALVTTGDQEKAAEGLKQKLGELDAAQGKHTQSAQQGAAASGLFSLALGKVTDLAARAGVDISVVTGAMSAMNEASRLSAGGLGAIGVAAGAAVISVAAFTGGLVASTQALVNQYRSIRDFQAVSGMTAGAADDLADAMERVGVQTSTLSMAMFRMAAEVESGGAKISKLGISLQELEGMAEGDALVLWLEKVQSLGSATEQMSALADVLGNRFARQLLPAISAATGGIREQIAAVSDLSPWTKEMSDTALRLSQAQTDLANATGGVAVAFGMAFAPTLTTTLAGLTRFMVGVRESVESSDLLKASIAVLTTTLRSLGDTLTLLTSGSGILTTILKGLVFAFALVGETIAMVMVPLTALIVGLKAASEAASFFIRGEFFDPAAWKRLETSLEQHRAAIKSAWDLYGKARENTDRVQEALQKLGQTATTVGAEIRAADVMGAVLGKRPTTGDVQAALDALTPTAVTKGPSKAALASAQADAEGRLAIVQAQVQQENALVAQGVAMRSRLETDAASAQIAGLQRVRAATVDAFTARMTALEKEGLTVAQKTAAQKGHAAELLQIDAQITAAQTQLLVAREKLNAEIERPLQLPDFAKLAIIEEIPFDNTTVQLEALQQVFANLKGQIDPGSEALKIIQGRIRDLQDELAASGKFALFDGLLAAVKQIEQSAAFENLSGQTRELVTATKPLTDAYNKLVVDIFALKGVSMETRAAMMAQADAQYAGAKATAEGTIATKTFNTELDKGNAALAAYENEAVKAAGGVTEYGKSLNAAVGNLRGLEQSQQTLQATTGLFGRALLDMQVTLKAFPDVIDPITGEMRDLTDQERRLVDQTVAATLALEQLRAQDALTRSLQDLSLRAQVLGTDFDAMGARVQAAQAYFNAMAVSARGEWTPALQEAGDALRSALADQRMHRDIQQGFLSITDTFTKMADGLIQGTLEIGTAFENLGQSLLANFAQIVIHRVFDPILEAAASFVSDLVSILMMRSAAPTLATAVAKLFGMGSPGGGGTVDLSDAALAAAFAGDDVSRLTGERSGGSTLSTLGSAGSGLSTGYSGLSWLLGPEVLNVAKLPSIASMAASAIKSVASAVGLIGPATEALSALTPASLAFAEGFVAAETAATGAAAAASGGAGASSAAGGGLGALGAAGGAGLVLAVPMLLGFLEGMGKEEIAWQRKEKERATIGFTGDVFSRLAEVQGGTRDIATDTAVRRDLAILRAQAEANARAGREAIDIGYVQSVLGSGDLGPLDWTQLGPVAEEWERSIRANVDAAESWAAQVEKLGIPSMGLEEDIGIGKNWQGPINAIGMGDQDIWAGYKGVFEKMLAPPPPPPPPPEEAAVVDPAAAEAARAQAELARALTAMREEAAETTKSYHAVADAMGVARQEAPDFVAWTSSTMEEMGFVLEGLRTGLLDAITDAATVDPAKIATLMQLGGALERLARQGEAASDTVTRVAADFVALFEYSGDLAAEADALLLSQQSTLTRLNAARAENDAAMADALAQRATALGTVHWEDLDPAAALAAQQTIRDLTMARYEMEIAAVTELTTTIQGFATSVTGIANTLAENSGFLTQLGIDLGETASSMIAFAGSLPDVDARITALGGAINLFFADLNQAVLETFPARAQGAQPLTAAEFEAGMASLLTQVMPNATDLLAGIRDAFTAAMAIEDPTARAAALEGVFDMLAGSVEGIGQALRASGLSLDQQKTIMGGVLDAVRPLGKDINAALITAGKDIATASKAASDELKTILGPYGTAQNLIADKVGDMAASLYTLATDITGPLGLAIAAAASSIVGAIPAPIPAAPMVLSGVLQTGADYVRGGIYQLHEGEGVYTPTANAVLRDLGLTNESLERLGAAPRVPAGVGAEGLAVMMADDEPEGDQTVNISFQFGDIHVTGDGDQAGRKIIAIVADAVDNTYLGERIVHRVTGRR